MDGEGKKRVPALMMKRVQKLVQRLVVQLALA